MPSIFHTPAFIENAEARLLALGLIMRVTTFAAAETVPSTSDNRASGDGNHAAPPIAAAAPATSTTIAPITITLQPTAVVGRRSFDAVASLMVLWNGVIDRVARDIPFLRETLRGSAASDSAFTGRFLTMLDEVYGAGAPVQQLMLGLFRSDYLHDASASCAEAEWKHVEINTISVSFAGLSPLVTEFHSFVAACGHAPGARQRHDAAARRSESGEELPRGMKAAVDAWDAVTAPARRDPRRPFVVCFVIQENERNTADQFRLAHTLLLDYNVRSVRLTLADIAQTMTLEEPCDADAAAGSPALPQSPSPPHAVIDGQYIALFYFRSCYTPRDFPTETQWAARRSIERSSAVKCPSLPHYLCTMKRIQQVLSEQETLLRFCKGDEAAAARLSRCFVGQYALDRIGEPATEATIADAVANPERYVLKPQLEGGGNLIFGEEMVRDLTASPERDAERFKHVRNEYILMEKIAIKPVDGFILRRSTTHVMSAAAGDALCYELGTFGVLLSAGADDVLLNKYAGHLVRTKRIRDTDGGVMSGVAALDAIAIIDDEGDEGAL